jgi:predicted transcriptional regulator of viral defense system
MGINRQNRKLLLENAERALFLFKEFSGICLTGSGTENVTRTSLSVSCRHPVDATEISYTSVVYLRTYRFSGINESMRYIEFRDSFHDLILFNTHELLVSHPQFHINRLSEWKRKGYIHALRKGYYIFADIELTHYIQFLIANTLYTPSYVSLETALSYHNFIPEIVYAHTSVTTRLPKQFHNEAGIYTYNQIKADAYRGYQLLPIPNHRRKVKIATPEKALLDYLYLHPEIARLDDFLSLRLNVEVLNQLDSEHLQTLALLFKQKKLVQRVNILLDSYDNHHA